jgi:hypothetical protein
MAVKKDIFIDVKEEKAALFKKRLLVLFISASMFINGFALSAGEISRHSIVLIAASLTYEMISGVVGKCGDSLAAVSNEISKHLEAFIFDETDEGEELSAGAKKGKKKEEGQKSGSAAGKAVIKEIRKGIEEAKTLITGTVLCVRELIKLYSRYKIGQEMGWVLLAFIIFIIGIRQRKGDGQYDAYIDNGNINIADTEKIKISA